MRPFAHGVYVNVMSEPAPHVQVAYGDRKYARLAALKSKYDPSNVFRFNQNIAPANRALPAAASRSATAAERNDRGVRPAPDTGRQRAA